MRICATSAWFMVWLAVGGCFYVSKDSFIDAWDRDEDGWPLGEEGDPDADCAPFNSSIHPFADDYRGDGCDADCGTTIDSDGDDFPDDGDCDSEDPTIYPCAPETEGDGIDSDCDGEDSARLEPCDTVNEGLDPIDPGDCPASLGGTAP